MEVEKGILERGKWGGGDLEPQLREVGGQRVVQLGMKTRMVQFVLLVQKYLLC
jgi:hypothetical protein